MLRRVFFVCFSLGLIVGQTGDGWAIWKEKQGRRLWLSRQLLQDLGEALMTIEQLLIRSEGVDWKISYANVGRTYTVCTYTFSREMRVLL